MQIYLVGGAVRDELLGLPVKERDWVVVGSTEAEMLAAGFQKVGKDFPVFLHPTTHEEYALARLERKIGTGYYGFTCDSAKTVTLEEDLQRRDLTINAIAKAQDGTIIDPYHGQQDLQQRVLRHVSSAFTEDPVRILRIARFAARFADLGFAVAAETQALMQQMVQANEVDHLVPERVWQELSRALAEPKPTAFVQVLKECGALARIFPALAALWGVPQPAKCHPEIDAGVHTIMTLESACKLTTDPKIRFAVLCHDVGKSMTPEAQLPDHHGHEELGAEIVRAWCQQYRVPHDYQELAVKFAAWHMYSHTAMKLTGAEIISLFNALDVFRKEQILEEFLLAAESDHRGRKDAENLPYPQADFLRQAFAIARQITAAIFIQQGFSGKALGEQIYQARIVAIDELLKVYLTLN